MGKLCALNLAGAYRLKSGHTVHRVQVVADRTGKVTTRHEVRYCIGVRTQVVLTGDVYPEVVTGFHGGGRVPLPHGNRIIGQSIFLGDLVGHDASVRAFRKKKHADRFEAAVLSEDLGYPGVAESLGAVRRYRTPVVSTVYVYPGAYPGGYLASQFA